MSDMKKKKKMKYISPLRRCKANSSGKITVSNCQRLGKLTTCQLIGWNIESKPTAQLTNSQWSNGINDKPTVAQIVKNFFAGYGSRSSLPFHDRGP